MSSAQGEASIRENGLAEKAHRSVDFVYDEVKRMAITYTFRPSQRINEVELAKQLNISRTPLREALSRLVSEGFLTTLPNRGFFCRPLDAKQLFDLYDFRCSLERSIVRLVCERASDEELEDLARYAEATRSVPEGTDPVRILHQDEEFHVRLAKLTRNAEFVASLTRINAQIHFARWIDMQTRNLSEFAHVELAEALKQRDFDKCDSLMQRHIGRRFEEIVSLIRFGFAEIYAGNTATGIPSESDAARLSNGLDD